MPGVEQPTGAMPMQPPQASAPAPSGTPSADQVPPAGEQEIAKARIAIAVSILEQQLPIFGAGTEEGAAVLNALKVLSKRFSGSTSKDVAPAELMNIMNAQPNDVQEQIKKQLGMAGAMPGGPQMPQQTPPQFT